MLTRLSSTIRLGGFSRASRDGHTSLAHGVADVAVGAYLLYVPQFFADVSFARWPHIARYMVGPSRGLRNETTV